MNTDDFSEITELREDLERDTEARPTAVQPAKIQFTAEQQEKVNQLIREAQGRAAKETREELSRTKAELEALKTTAPKSDPDAADIARELALTRAERDALKREKSEVAVNSELMKAAAAANFIDPTIAVDLVRNRVRMVDGRLVAVDADGNQRLNSQLEPMTAHEALAELANEKSFLIRSDVRSGSGSVESRGGNHRGPQLEQLFGKNALPDAARILNDLAKRDPAAYRRMRDAAREKGLR